jgi:Zn ribbon nucleic-acid-binding protein
MKILTCPKCKQPPSLEQYPFNKFWKAQCHDCGYGGEAFKKKSDAVKSWERATATTDLSEDPCPNHPTVMLRKHQGCAICANST